MQIRDLNKYWTISTRDNKHIYITKDEKKVENFLKILKDKLSYNRVEIIVSSIYEVTN